MTDIGNSKATKAPFASVILSEGVGSRSEAATHSKEPLQAGATNAPSRDFHQVSNSLLMGSPDSIRVF
jgi:hypothetical protein